MSTAPGVCALGWVKYREHISLLVILCIIVYVTNIYKNNYIYIYIFFLPITDYGKMLISVNIYIDRSLISIFDIKDISIKDFKVTFSQNVP